MTLQGERACKGLPLPSTVRGGEQGKEASFNYLLHTFPWRWLRKLVRTFSVETNSGSHSPSPGLLATLAACTVWAQRTPGRAMGTAEPFFCQLLSGTAGESGSRLRRPELEVLWCGGHLLPCWRRSDQSALQDTTVGAACCPTSPTGSVNNVVA